MIEDCLAVGVRKLTPTYGAAPQGAQAGLHAVPGKENDHLIATGNPVHERFLRLDHASVVEVVVLQHVESRSLEFARDGCCVVAGLFQFGCFLVGIVADDQRDPSAARCALSGEVAGWGRGLGRRAGLRGRVSDRGWKNLPSDSNRLGAGSAAYAQASDKVAMAAITATRSRDNRRRPGMEGSRSGGQGRRCSPGASPRVFLVAATSSTNQATFIDNASSQDNLDNKGVIEGAGRSALFDREALTSVIASSPVRGGLKV